MTGPMASPSRPSVRLTAFDQATTTRTAKGTYTQSGTCIGCLENATKGIERWFRIASQSVGSSDVARKQ
jgi:hypothetical protein